ncbi:Sec39 domain [Dillenia turbinata]|uniref:Sec39 domain n=1 Tax=Dillenia turbinata TaxID=194707 RepID=A0AAN8ZDI2_9MAGN
MFQKKRELPWNRYLGWKQIVPVKVHLLLGPDRTGTEGPGAGPVLGTGSSSVVTFNHGVWSESHDVLLVADDTDTLYFIRPNGEEIRRIIKRHSKLSTSVEGLLLLNDSDTLSTSLCSFVVLTSDGYLNQVEISQEPSSSFHPLNSGLAPRKQFPRNIFCSSYYPEFSLLLLVGSSVAGPQTFTANAGSYEFSLWRVTVNLDLELVFSTQIKGLYYQPKSYGSLSACPKVLISPQGNFVGTLDLRGCLDIFKLEGSLLSCFEFGDSCKSRVTNYNSKEGTDLLLNVLDFTWWSDRILVLAKKNGAVTMFDIASGAKLLESDTKYFMPVLERVPQMLGHIFLLESTIPEGQIEHFSENILDQFNFARFCWSLISFSEKSVDDMYHILLRDHKYQAALEFANFHGLDKDEVTKSRWLHSDQGKHEVKMFLSQIQDQNFVLSECLEKVGQTEEAEEALLLCGLHLTDKYRFSTSEDIESDGVWDFRLARLHLLQFKDKLETFLGINMGRYSIPDYCKFRTLPINEAAITLAESGKIGALNLLFKRHPYSLTPSMLEILAAIPETVPVQTYGQLLPGNSPPMTAALRDSDWVECQKMISFIHRLPEKYEGDDLIKTEPLLKQCLKFFWPSNDELSSWYKNRAKEIDSFSGQLDNCLSLVEFGCRKGISELRKFYDDISYMDQLIYSGSSNDQIDFTMGLDAWERLNEYEKFKMMLKGVKEENVVERLQNQAISFMQNRSNDVTSVSQDRRARDSSVDLESTDSFMVRWLKETAAQNELEVCLAVFEEGCREFQSGRIFKNEVEAIDCALQCIYLSTATEKWNTMASILSKLPRVLDAELFVEDLEKRLKLAEGQIEAGRLLAFYQVPKPMGFLLEAHSDAKGVKQILRLILSKFIRRKPGQSDNDWAIMWRDMQSLQEKAFPFLDLEFMLMEFCGRLLKAGKFSLARNYLKGTSSVSLASEKAESIVIQAAREYFFSASSLACPEIWKAKECLNLFSSSRNVKAETDIIDALTVKLPNLGVTLLPMQFRQIKDPMEIIKMAITSQAGAYLNVDELIEIAKLLGLDSQDEISAVQEAIAREAAAAGDLQLAFDLCLVLSKNGYGVIWDLCAAIARGPPLENMGISSRKQLLGFAMSHCDEESICELLHAWKDLDLQAQYETLATLSGTNPPSHSVQSSTIFSLPGFHDVAALGDCSELVQGVGSDDQQAYFKDIKNIIAEVAKNFPLESGTDWECLLRENGKVLPFTALELPWLLDLSKNIENGKIFIPGSFSGKKYASVRALAVLSVLSWLTRNGFVPKDNLIASLAKSVMEPPVSKEKDIIGCSLLLNLADAFHGVEVIEEQLRMREEYQDISNIMNVGMMYSILHNTGINSDDPAHRRGLLLKKFQEKHTQLSFDELEKLDQVHSSFWREWKVKLEKQKHTADHSRMLEQIIPGVEAARFLAGDSDYIKNVIFSLVESAKLEKKHILKDALKLSDTYGLNRMQVLLQYLSAVLVSEVWTEADIAAEITEFLPEIYACAAEAIKAISFIVYPAIDGHNKLRLSYIFGLLSAIYLHLEQTKEALLVTNSDQVVGPAHGLAHFYKVVEQECRRVSFIKDLNFKNIVGINGLNYEFFNGEVCHHIDEQNLKELAKMVKTLTSIHPDPLPEGLITWQDVYKYYVLSLLKNMESRFDLNAENGNPDKILALVSELEETYGSCRMHIRLVAHSDALDIVKRFFVVIVHVTSSFGDLPNHTTWQNCLVLLLSFWIKVTEDMQELANDFTSAKKVEFNPEFLMTCLKVLINLVMENIVSPSQGRSTVVGYVNYGLRGNNTFEIFIFCRAMIFSGCRFGAVAEFFNDVVSHFPRLSLGSEANCHGVNYLQRLYLDILEPILQDLVNGSHEHQYLHYLLSSLSPAEGNVEDLKMMRHAIWERMVNFSDDLKLPSSVRVYALELMQYLSGQNVKGMSADLQSSVLPWDGWEVFHQVNTNTEATESQGVPNQPDASSRLSSTLVALKSSQLATAISADIAINRDDLLTVESTTSCFLRLLNAVTAEAHVNALIAILTEWEDHFSIKEEKEDQVLASDTGNSWSNDDWDEGWESFQEEPVEKEVKKEGLPITNPLHACWLEFFRKLIVLSRFRDVIELMDQRIAKSNGVVLDEDGARNLSQSLLGIDCLLALKMALLLPYESIQLQCLDTVESKLKEGNISESAERGHELLLLLLSSGLISSIITKASYHTIFSYLCLLVGNLSRLYQESELLRLNSKVKKSDDHRKDSFHLFKIILFPCFISEIVKADQHVLAGFMVTKLMHTNASLSLLNVAQASLAWYLSSHLQLVEENQLEMHSFKSLEHTIYGLKGKMGPLIKSALSSLPANPR